MYTKIVAQVFDQTLRVTNIPKLASGGENEVRVEVTFDTLWTGFGKTAIFYRENKKNQVYHVVMKSDSCIIPREVMVEPGVVCFGILGTSGSTVRTTEVVALTVAQGAITGLSSFEPLPDVYKQVLSAYATTANDVSVERARLDALIASGGTSDDAELLDVRVGYDGTTYSSAGTSVRQQIARKLDVDGENQIGAFNVDFLAPNGAVDYFREKLPYRANANFSSTGFWSDDAYDVYRIKVDPETTYIMGRTLSEGLDGLLIPKLMYSTVSNFDAGMTATVIDSVVSVAYGSAFTTPRGCAYIYAMLQKTQVGAETPVLQKGRQLLPLQTGYRLTENVVNVRKSDCAGLKWVAIGDSLTDPATLAAETETANYVDLVAGALGLNVVNFGESGSGYQNAYADHKAFYQRALTVPSDADVITIFGSGNDSTFAQNYVADHEGSVGNWYDTWDGSDVTLFEKNAVSYCAVVNHTLDNLLSVAPYARIGVISMTPWTDQQNDEEYTPIMRKMSDALRDICEHRGIPFLDLYRCSQMRPNNAAFRSAMFVNGDGVHPNSDGHRRYVYPQIRECVARML